MKLMIVDDEPLARQRLRCMVEAFPGHEVIAEAGDGARALACIADTAADAVLLDVHMPGMDGLQVARALARLDVPPAMIFVTAHSEHALSALDCQPAGYLLKPVKQADLAAVLARACRPSRAQMAALVGVEAPAVCGYVTARTRDGLQRVAIADVLYFRADHKYTSVFHMHGELLIEQSLLTLETRFSDDFMRVHRKILVARRYISGLQVDPCDGPVISLRHSDARLPVARRRLTDVRALLVA